MYRKIVYLNSIIIAFLTIIAASSGLLWKGLYKNDTVSVMSMAMGQDLVTLVICVPILLASCYLISRGSIRGRLMWMGLMWMGALFYFTYTYAVASFMVSYNQLFLIYVALFSISLYTFLAGLLSLDVENIKASFSRAVTIKIAAVFSVIMGVLLALMWLQMIIASLLTGSDPSALTGYTTLVVQAMDLGVIVPAAIAAGLLLLKGNEWGYALTSIVLIKASLLGTAILSMIVFMALNDVSTAFGQILFFMVLTAGGIIIAIAFYGKTNETVIHGTITERATG